MQNPRLAFFSDCAIENILFARLSYCAGMGFGIMLLNLGDDPSGRQNKEARR